MDGRRVSHSWCMGVVSLSYGGLGQGWRWWLVCLQGKTMEVGLMLRDVVALSMCKVKSLMSPKHSLSGVQLCVGLSQNWSVFMGRL